MTYVVSSQFKAQLISRDDFQLFPVFAHNIGQTQPSPKSPTTSLSSKGLGLFTMLINLTAVFKNPHHHYTSRCVQFNLSMTGVTLACLRSPLTNRQQFVTSATRPHLSLISTKVPPWEAVFKSPLFILQMLPLSSNIKGMVSTPILTLHLHQNPSLW